MGSWAHPHGSPSSGTAHVLPVSHRSCGVGTLFPAVFWCWGSPGSQEILCAVLTSKLRNQKLLGRFKASWNITVGLFWIIFFLLVISTGRISLEHLKQILNMLVVGRGVVNGTTSCPTHAELLESAVVAQSTGVREAAACYAASGTSPNPMQQIE